MGRAPIETMFNGVAWTPVAQPEGMSDDDGTPFITHSGTLDIAGFPFRCYQLSDGTRIVDAEDVEAFFGVGSRA